MNKHLILCPGDHPALFQSILNSLQNTKLVSLPVFVLFLNRTEHKIFWTATVLIQISNTQMKSNLLMFYQNFFFIGNCILLNHTDNCFNFLPFSPQRTEWWVFIDKNKKQKHISFCTFYPYSLLIKLVCIYFVLSHVSLTGSLPYYFAWSKSLLSHTLN